MKIFKPYLLFILLLWLMAGCTENKKETSENTVSADAKKYVMVIHGGAGAISKAKMTPEKQEAYKAALTSALKAGYTAIESGKSSLDAVQAAINVMEDSPLFNAGKGAVFTNEGKNEMDASIMEGKGLKAGAVAGVSTLKNPINAARAVMEQSEHVMMAGKGAEEFAKSVGIETVDSTYFYTEQRWNELQKEVESGIDRAAFKGAPREELSTEALNRALGTVGSVALDKNGNLAAGTSTGGMTNKRYGRIGDSPIIGAGTYCNNKTAGISSTGWGEYYIRTVAAHRISDLIELKGLTLVQAAKQTIAEIGELGGDGGVIGLNQNGEYMMEYNTQGMYRGVVDEEGNMQIFIYEEEL